MRSNSPFSPPAGGRGRREAPGWASLRPTERAKQLRNAATPPEKRLWLQLKGRQIADAKFSRQMPVGPYFADFLCREHKLVVEVDGQSHDMTFDHDRARTAFLRRQGYRVLRFSNRDVMNNLDGVIASIAAALTPTPLAAQAAPPAGGRGEE